MSPASSYIQPEQMSEFEGDVGKNMYMLALLHGGGSIMVWGCMSAGGVDQLIVCEGTINSP